MKKSLVVLLVLLTTVCVFAADFTVGAKLGFATGGTSMLKDKSVKTYWDKEQITFSGFAIDVDGSYQIDPHYSAEVNAEIIIPTKVTYNYMAGAVKQGIEGNRKDFGKGSFFAFKVRGGVGYVLPVDSALDFKVGGGLELANVSVKGNELEAVPNQKNNAFTVGIYAFGQASYPVAKNLAIAGSLYADFDLYGKTKYASGLMFHPGIAFSVGATYNF